MSIITMQKKSNTINRSVSRDGGFSLNGKNFGQHNYINSPRKANANKSLPASFIAGESVSINQTNVSFSTQLRNKYRYVLRPYPYGSTKPNINVPHNIENVVKSACTFDFQSNLLALRQTTHFGSVPV